MDNRGRYFSDHALGIGRLVIRIFPCQLPDEKFLEEICGSSFPNFESRVCKR